MPFTPFHLGVGLICKAPRPKRFSLTIFTTTQVAIDLESGFNLVFGRDPVHRFCHTFLGATLVCLVVALILRRPLETLSRLLRPMLPPLWPMAPEITVRVALVSAAVGMVGHVIPDAIMHSDSRPFTPFSDTNPFLGVLSLEILHIGLMALGIAGLSWLRIVAWRAAR